MLEYNSCMLNYISSFLKTYEYSKECEEVLLSTCDTLIKQNQFDELLSIADLYKINSTLTYQELANKVERYSNKANIDECTVWLIVFILMSKTLKEIYKTLNYSDYVYKYSMYDIKYKAIECYLVKGVWGNFVSTWTYGFFNLKLFGFSALQFEPGKLDKDYLVNGRLIKQGTEILNVHIPRREKHLDEKEVKRNMKDAIKFFGYSDPIFCCHSWLLFPKNKEMLSPSSHLSHFINLFTLVNSYEYSDYSELWRLFDMEIDENNLDTLPDNTSFRRSYIKLMKNKEKIGGGFGIYLPSKEDD